MNHRFVLAVVVLLVALLGCASAARRMAPIPTQVTMLGRPTNFEERYIEQVLDHHTPYASDTYMQRYFVSTARFNSSSDGPLLFLYIGGEADIEYYWHSSGGYFREMAARAGAALVFLEHRAYGQSSTETLDQMKPFLTIENALADMAEFLIQLNANDKKTYRVVVAGGSYAGELAMWARVRYPHLVKVAVGSSAPIQMMGRPYSPTDPMNFEYFRKVTETFDLISPKCPHIVRAGYVQLEKLYKANNVEQIRTTLNLANPLKPNDEDEIEHLRLWIRQAYINLAQTNHPNAKKELSWPVARSCNAMLESIATKPTDPLYAIRVAMDIAYGPVPHDIYEEFVQCADESGCGSDDSGISWDFQACSQLVYYPTSTNTTDMFPPRVHSLQMHQDYCRKAHGIDISRFNRHLSLSRDFPNYDRDWVDVKNVILTNGLLDPWCSGSVQQSLSPYFLVINIPGASHHLDLNTPTPNDPEWIHPVRELLYELILEMAKPVPDHNYLLEMQWRIKREYPLDCFSPLKRN